VFATVNKKKLGSCLEFLVKPVLLSEWRFSHTRLVQWDLHNDAIVFVLWKNTRWNDKKTCSDIPR
jgi:hypothetical protein